MFTNNLAKTGFGVTLPQEAWEKASGCLTQQWTTHDTSCTLLLLIIYDQLLWNIVQDC